MSRQPGRGGRGGGGGGGGTGGRGGDPARPGVPATEGQPGAPGEAGQRGERGEPGPPGRGFLGNGKGRYFAFTFVVLAAVYSVWRVEGVADDAAATAAEAKRLSRVNTQLIARIERNTRAQARESKERIDQSCQLFERQHKTDIETYEAEIRSMRIINDFIAGLTPEERLEDFNALLIRELPQVRADYQKARKQALLDAAPDYCDEPGVRAERLWRRSNGQQGAPPVGLKEPDPELPKDPFAPPPKGK